jgi:hypothetical protein
LICSQVQTAFDAENARPQPQARVTADELAALLAAGGGGDGSGKQSTSSSVELGVLVVDTRNVEQYVGQVCRAACLSIL